MTEMEYERFELRLDTERKQKLRRIAEARGQSLTYAVRDLIDQAIENAELEDRLRIVDRLAALNLEDVPEPAVLSRELESALDVPDLP